MPDKFEKVTICLDMAGCPNMCRHCWLGHSKNMMLEQEDLIFVSEKFRKLSEELTVYSWFREPDYRDDYKELWGLENKLSFIAKPERFELLSVWRLNRDRDYLSWLKTLDVICYQLTFFGMEEKTDYYTGRKGAFKELLCATEMLLNNGFIPRWQAFIYHDNVREMSDILDLLKEMKLKKRCEDLGGKFNFFVHQGSCEGEGRVLYNNWLTEDDIELIPQELIETSMVHMDCCSLDELFGKPEKELIIEFLDENSVIDLSERLPVLYINNNFDVYPNFSERSLWFKLGNLKTDSAKEILQRYKHNYSFAQRASCEVPVSEMAELIGDKNSNRLFMKTDYRWYLLNNFCKKYFVY